MARSNTFLVISCETMRKTFAVFLLCIPLVFCCTKKNGDLRSDRKPSRLRWAISKDPETLDWTFCKDSRCYSQVALLMEGLFTIGFEGGTPRAVPLLAESWQKTGSRLVIKIRDGIEWSDGAPLRATHFIEAWRRLLSRADETSFASFLFSISNARAFSEGRISFDSVGIGSSDPLTLVIEFAKHSPTFLFQLSHPALWPVRVEKGLESHQTVLGPFLPKHWKRGVEIGYVRNPRYHGGSVHLDGIEVKIVPDASSRIQLFLNQELHLMDEIPMSLLPLVADHPALQHEPTLRWVGLAFSGRRPFSAAKARMALQQAIDRQDMLRTLKWPHFATTRLLAGTISNPFPSWALKFAPTSARNMLAEMKLISSDVSRSFSELPPTLAPRLLLGWENIENAGEIADNLRAQWQKNLKIRTEFLNDTDDKRKTTANPVPSVMLIERHADPFSPLQGLESLHPVVEWQKDALVGQVRQKDSIESLMTLLQEAEETLISKEGVVAPLFFRAKSVLKNPAVQHLTHAPLTFWDFRATTMQ